MQALTLPARRGWQWFGEGFAIFRRNPPLLSLAVLATWFQLMFFGALPVIGGLLSSILLPMASVLLFHVCRDIDQGRTFSLRLLLAGLRSAWKPLAGLGAVYLGGTLLIAALTALFDDGLLLNALLTGHLPEAEEISDNSMLGAQIALLLLLPLLMAYWFAPPLVGWNRLPIAKAFFFSFFATLRNWRAMFMYSVAIAVWGAIVPGLLLLLVAMVMPEASGALAGILTLPLLFILLPTLVASSYVSYRDVFVDRPQHIDDLV